MPSSGKKEPVLLSGPTPGLVDPSQRSRLLRTPGTSLFFAAFDPHTARTNSFPNLSSLHIDPEKGSASTSRDTNASSGGKRVVIETDLENGTCTWRFVPRARVDEGLFGDEGSWPRLVELCGRLVRMTQDQWDLHKLDPEYDCFVRTPPDLTTITRKNITIPDPEASNAAEEPSTPKAEPVPMEDSAATPKAQQPSPSSDSESPRKRRRTRGRPRSSSPESDRMVVDEEEFYFHSSPPNKQKAQDAENRRKRRRVSEFLGEMGASKTEASKPRGYPEFADASSNPGRGRAGRTSDGDAEEMPPKKPRTRSPGTARRELEQMRLDREKKRKVDMEARLKRRKDAMNRAFWNELGVPSAVHDPSFRRDESNADSDGESAQTDATTDSENEATRLAKIEESRRKLAELEKDKPLWEESARRRQHREWEEEQKRQRAKALKEEEERQRRQAEAARRQLEERWEQEQRDREREARIRDRGRRMFVLSPHRGLHWNVRLALERYLQTAATFDATKFSTSNPLTFAGIPWPLLPGSYAVQDIQWDAVETFFEKVESLMHSTEFKELVEKSQRRFHPDRWRSRRLLLSVSDETDRDLLEVAGSTVAQALTPLWKKITGR